MFNCAKVNYIPLYSYTPVSSSRQHYHLSTVRQISLIKAVYKNSLSTRIDSCYVFTEIHITVDSPTLICECLAYKALKAFSTSHYQVILVLYIKMTVIY